MSNAAHAHPTRSATVLVYAVPNTDLRVLVDGILDPQDLLDAEQIAMGVVRQLAALPRSRCRTRVLRMDDITDFPPTPPHIEP